MSEAPLWVWGVLALLLLVSSVFSSSETALFSLTESQRARAGLTVRRLLARPRDLLVVVLIGNLVVNLLFFTVVLRLHPLEGGSLLVDVGALVALLLCGEILDLFYSTKEVGKGSGLGLALVHNTVASHGGQVEIHSEEGHGFTVEMRLPTGGRSS